MSNDLRKYLKISRPKFWLYLAGPYMLGGVLAVEALDQLADWRFWSLLIWFSFPANLLLYGVNDAADFDTDQHNPKKAGGEALVQPRERGPLLRFVAALALTAVPALLASPPRAVLWVGVFIALSLAYSAPPVRLKARPGLDSLSNALYLAPLLVGWSLYRDELPPLSLTAAGILWCAAMHAYSAIPDIEADRRAGLSTIATALGRDRALLFCLCAYWAAALLVFDRDRLAGLGLGLYPLILGAQLLRARSRVSAWYRHFPAVNALVGMFMTLRFLWPISPLGG
jgi:4-hydroxybenzoate polyprenyltransferase